MDDEPTQSQADPGPPPEPTAPPLPPVAQRQLRRRRQRRVLAGVAGGIADFLGIDPVLVRVLLVVLVALGGSGAVLYVLLWATIPAEGAQESGAEALLRRVRAAPPWLQAILAGAAFVLIVQGFVGEGVGVFTGVVLIAIGIALFGREQLEQPAAATASASPGTAGATRLDWSSTALAPSPPLWAPPVPQPTRPRSILGRLTLAVALLVLGIVALLDLIGLVELTAERLLALLLMVVGAGLLVGARRGRARGLIALGVLLLPPLIALNLIGPLARGGIGDRTVRPADVSQLDDEYQHFLGTSVVDLSRVEFPQEPAEVSASIALGDLTVIVPPDVAVTARGAVGGGVLDLLGQTDEGDGVSLVVTGRGQEGGGRLELDVEAGVGSIEVRRAGSEEGVPR